MPDAPIIHSDFAERLALASARRKTRPADPRDWSIAEARGIYEMSQPPAPEISVGRVEEVSFPGPTRTLRMRVYTPPGEGPFPVIMYLHGGGFLYGSLDTHDAPCRLMCQLTGAIVASVDYRLAPEFKIPAAHDDCWSALTWLAGNAATLNGDATRLAVAGDSAGGNLAANMCIMSRDRGGPELLFQLLLVPGLDADLAVESFELRQNDFLYPEMIRYFLENMVADPEAIEHPHNRNLPICLRPVDVEDLSGLPPAMIMVAECDMIYDYGKKYADRLRNANVQTEFVVGKGMIHQFTSLAHIYPSARPYFEQACAALRAAVFAWR